MRRRHLAAIAFLLATGCAGGSPDATPTPAPTPTPAIQGVQVFGDPSHEHVPTGPSDYPQSPPVGGAHSQVWLACGIYTEQVPKQNAVHSIEHGAIWLTYSTDLPAAQIAQLEQLAGLAPEYVLVSPYSGQDSPVVATTWGLQLRVPDASDPRLVRFIKAYAGGNQGGEQGVGCKRGGATLEQAKEHNSR